MTPPDAREEREMDEWLTGALLAALGWLIGFRVGRRERNRGPR
jgi:hypothetical protein